jgi:hypothetical protein
MLRAMAAVMFVVQRCIPHWSRVLTLVALVRVRKQLSRLALRVLLPRLQILIRMLPELALMHYVQQVLKLLLMCWQTKCLLNLRHICIIAAQVAPS